MASSTEPLLDQIMGVMDAAFAPEFGEAWTRRQISDSLAIPNIQALVIGASGEEPPPDKDAAGFALSRRAADEEELLLIAVRPEARRRTLGSQLIKKFLSSARENGVAHVFLEMREGNPAESLYLRHGFNPIGRRKLYYLGKDGVRRDAITYGRKL